MEEKEYNVVTLEDGIEYTEIDRVKKDGNTYVFLSNLDNPNNFCIRKVIKEDEEDYIVGLEDDTEFDEVLKLFGDKYQN